MTTLDDLGGVCGTALDIFFWPFTILWSKLLGRVWSGPKGTWPFLSKHSHRWKRWSRFKFTSHYTWGTNGVSECKMDISWDWPLDTLQSWKYLQRILGRHNKLLLDLESHIFTQGRISAYMPEHCMIGKDICAKTWNCSLQLMYRIACFYITQYKICLGTENNVGNCHPWRSRP